uniref:KIB1-4 beta-propeller domain-containing protein n=1 Tax=Arundo donax TaxID=35708 RepID=A0A0A8XYV7_ARUDO
MIIPDAIDEAIGFEKVFMVESNQELYMVSMLSSYDLDTVFQVTVHKLDISKQEWIQVADLGGQVFLLSSWYFGASRSADKCGLEQNCVYLVDPWDKCLTVYNIKDGTSKVQDLKEAPASQQALWMLPNDH